MGYNKRQFQKTNDKKVLHKVRKHWVVVSLAMLMALGGGALATHTASANADATNANNGNNVNNTQSVKENLNSKLQSNQINANQNNASANQNNQKVSSNAIQQRAEALHNEILGNAAQHQATNNANANSASQSNQNASAQQQPNAQGRQAAPQVNNNGVKANVPSHKGFGAVKLGNPNDANLNNNQVAVDQNSDKQSANAPKRLLGDDAPTYKGVKAPAFNDYQNSFINNNGSSDSPQVWVDYDDVSKENIMNSQPQSDTPGASFDLKDARNDIPSGYYYLGVKGATTDMPGHNLEQSDTIPYSNDGDVNHINIMVAPVKKPNTTAGRVVYVYFNDANNSGINTQKDSDIAGTQILNPNGFESLIPKGYKYDPTQGVTSNVQGLVNKVANKGTVSDYNLPTKVPAGFNNIVYIHLTPIAQPTVTSAFEYIDENNGEPVGEEDDSGQNGESIRDFNNYKKFVPSGYTFDASNPLNSDSHMDMNYKQGNINYLYVKSNTPDNTSDGYVNLIFKDKLNNKIVDQQVLTGKVGSDVDTSQGQINTMIPYGYTSAGADTNNPTVKQYKNNLQSLTYYVTSNGDNIPSDVTEDISYVDYKNPNVTYGNDTITGIPGKLINWNQYTSMLPSDTKFVSLGQHNSNFTNGGKSTVYVKKLSVQAKPITVNYINQHGVKVISHTVNGAYGQNYSDITQARNNMSQPVSSTNPLLAPVPEGYSLNNNKGNKISQNLNYTVGSDAQTINVFVNGNHYSVPLTVNSKVNGKQVDSKTTNISGQVGDSTVIDTGSYNPDSASDYSTSNNQTVTMSSTNNGKDGAINPSTITFNYKKINYNTPGYDPLATKPDKSSDYNPSNNTPYPSDNPSDSPLTRNGNNVPSGYIPGWVPAKASEPNGAHTNGYIPSNHVPKGYVPGLVPNGNGGYVPGYVDPNHLPTNSKNGKDGNGNTIYVPNYVAGKVPSGSGNGSVSGLVPDGSILVHYIDANDKSHNSIDTEAASGQPGDPFDVTAYTKNLPNGYALNSIDYGTNNYNNDKAAAINQFNGNNQDINIIVNKMATAKVNYVDKNGNVYPGMSKTINGVDGTLLHASDYQNYLPLGYTKDSNQPTDSSNNNWILNNGKTYTVRVDKSNVEPTQANNNNGVITVKYKDVSAGPNNGNIIATVNTVGANGSSFSPLVNTYDQVAPKGYNTTTASGSSDAFEGGSVISDMTFNSSKPQTAVVDVTENGTVPSDSTDTVNYYNVDGGAKIATRKITGKTGSTIDWSPLEEYLPASKPGQYWSFDYLGSHNNQYSGGTNNNIYLKPALHVHKNGTPGYDPDNTMTTNSDYFASDNNPYQSDDPSDPDLAATRANINDGNVYGGKIPSNYVPGWVPADPSKPNGAHKSGYIPSDDIPQGYIPGQVPNGKGSYVPGYVPSDASLQPAGSTNGKDPNGNNIVVPKYVPGTVTGNKGNKIPAMVPSTNSIITIHYINADDGNKTVNSVALDGALNQKFDVGTYQTNVPKGYSYIQTNYGANNYNVSGTNQGTPVTSYDGTDHDVNIMLHRTNTMTVDYVDKSGNVVKTLTQTGENDAAAKSSDYTDFIPYGYTLNKTTPSSGTWKYDGGTDIVNLVNKKDSAKTPSDNKTTKKYGYVNIVYKDASDGDTVGSYALAGSDGTQFNSTVYQNAFAPKGYNNGNWVSPIQASTTYFHAGQTTEVDQLVSKNGQSTTAPTSDTITYVDADDDKYQGQSLKNQPIAETKIIGKAGSKIDYTPFEKNLPSADGGNWAYDFMGPHDNKIAGNGATIYIHKAKPAKQFGKITINYVGPDHQKRGSDTINGIAGSEFDVAKYEDNIPGNSSDASTNWTFDHASDVPLTFNNDDVNGQTMTVHVVPPVQVHPYGNITVTYKDDSGAVIGNPVTISGANNEMFDPTSFENNIPQGYEYTGMQNAIYNFIGGQNLNMTVNVSKND